MLSQKKHLRSQTYQNLAFCIVSSFNKRQIIWQNIIHWEKLWVNNNEIPRSKKAENYELWINNENVTMAVQNFGRKEEDNKLILTIR